jgi:hypothetical protein
MGLLDPGAAGTVVPGDRYPAAGQPGPIGFHPRCRTAHGVSDRRSFEKPRVAEARMVHEHYTRSVGAWPGHSMAMRLRAVPLALPEPGGAVRVG